MRAAVLIFLLGPWAGAADGVFRGESCASCHAGVRDAAPAPAAVASERMREVIVVGGGLSGLAAAYALRARDVLVLEKEDAAGGKARRESWEGRRYPVAAGYMAELYNDEIKALFKDLGLAGERIPEPTNALRTPDGRTLLDPYGKGLAALPAGEAEKKEFGRLMADLAKFSSDPELAVPPVPRRPTKRQKALDAEPFFDYVARRYGKAPAAFADRYSRSLFGVGAREVSAWAGMIFLAADFGPSGNITWDGGPGVISERLAERLGPARLELGALVTRVSREKDSVVVEYLKDGRRRAQKARAVVIAVPSFVAKRLIAGLPERKKAALGRVRYSSYAVGIVALDRPIYADSFDVWSGSDTIFTDLEPLEWGRPAGKTEGPAQLLEAFLPLGGSEGRSVLLSASDESLSARIVDGLEALFPGSRALVHGVRLIRWGHAMPIDYPGYLTTRREEVAAPLGPLLFAGVDTEMPCLEGAILSGLRAAGEAETLLAAEKP